MTDPISSAAKPVQLQHVTSTIAATNPRASWWFAHNAGDTAETVPNAETNGVMIKCAGCEFSGKISDALGGPVRDDGTHGHRIDAGGVVEPSIKCPKCSWHAFAVLGGWISPDPEDVVMPPSTGNDEPAPPAVPTPPPTPVAEIEAKAEAPAAPTTKTISQCPICRATFAIDLAGMAKAHPHTVFRHGNCPICFKGKLQQITLQMPAVSVRLKDAVK